MNWYYSIELAPGESTSGHRHANVAATRALLRGVELAGASCLDIGTQEALLPVLMKRAGADYVAAYDRLDLEERVSRVQKAYGVAFDYIGGRPLAELPAALEARARRTFDVVVFSGVMYHMINPLGGLATARGFCRNGGLFVVETAAMQSTEMAMHFNAGGKLYGSHANFFVPTVACLDYFLRMLGLQPLRGAWIGSTAEGSINRVAVLCRSEPRAVPRDASDAWSGAEHVRNNFAADAAVRWDLLESDAPPVALKEAFAPAVPIAAGQGLHEWIAMTAPFVARDEDTVLALASTM